MKFIKNTVLMLGIMSAFSIFNIDNAMATACNKKTIPAGYWCKAGGAELPCREGCYCEGAINVEGVNAARNIQTYCDDRGNEEAHAEQGIHLCPESHPKSDEYATNIYECYFIYTYNSSTNASRKVYNRYQTLPSGRFFKKNTDVEEICKMGYYCHGGSYIPSRIEEVGLEKCPEDFPNSDVGSSSKTNCYKLENGKKIYFSENTGSVSTAGSTNIVAYTAVVSIHCEAGKYLPGGSVVCEPCSEYSGNYDEYYCPGGDFDKSDEDQGIYLCKNHKIANSDHTGCIVDQDNIYVPAGKYLPANKTEYKPCIYGNVCPGGVFEKDNKTQGLYTCPYGSPTSDRKGCSMNLNKQQMQQGPSGKGNCWKIRNSNDYKRCIYGFDFPEFGFEDFDYDTKEGCEDAGCTWNGVACVCPANNNFYPGLSQLSGGGNVSPVVDTTCDYANKTACEKAGCAWLPSKKNTITGINTKSTDSPRYSSDSLQITNSSPGKCVKIKAL